MRGQVGRQAAAGRGPAAPTWRHPHLLFDGLLHDIKGLAGAGWATAEERTLPLLLLLLQGALQPEVAIVNI